MARDFYGRYSNGAGRPQNRLNGDVGPSILWLRPGSLPGQNTGK